MIADTIRQAIHRNLYYRFNTDANVFCVRNDENGHTDIHIRILDVDETRCKNAINDLLALYCSYLESDDSMVSMRMTDDRAQVFVKNFGNI